ncbi:MAG TPA: PAS domain-containing protein [Syntrophorhabdales bacterium]|nr:PAS domain-containing protein [Syntrophorhabdales bacterium]
MDEATLRSILDALPFPVVFVDTSHTIRFMNKRAKFHYYEERGYRNLIGTSVFECHNETSRERIVKIVERFKNHGREVFLTVTDKNERLYVTPVRNDAGELIGYFERFEGNFQK